MNFPEKIVAGNQNVSYIYSASGEKLAANANGSLTYYRSVMVYGNDNMLLYMTHPEGTVTCTEGSAGTSYTYNYFKRDQVGSTRAVLSAVGNTLQNVQSTDYYPFGLAHATNNLNKNKILFSGKELQDSGAETSGSTLSMYDFGARQYDSFIGCWLKQDRYAKKYASASPYNYCVNNPISITDPTGDTLKVHVGDKTYIYASNAWGYGFYNTDGSEAKKMSSLALTMLWNLRTIGQPGKEVGPSLIHDLSNSSFNYTIEYNSGGKNSFRVDNQYSGACNLPNFEQSLTAAERAYFHTLPSGSGGTIKYDPYSFYGGPNENGDTYRPPFIGLSHELGHAHDAMLGSRFPYAGETYNSYPNTFMGISANDWSAVYWENQIRQEHDLPLRTHYYNDPLRGPSGVRMVAPIPYSNAGTPLDLWRAGTTYY